MSSDKILLTGPLAKLEFKGHLNLITREVDFTSSIKLIDNLKIPLLSHILDNAARIPLAPKLGLITISGNWKDPEIEYKLFK
jgi:Predicted membrane protein